MTTNRISRRRVATLIAGGAAVAGSAAIGPAAAYQGNMDRALASLQAALIALREATPNKGGHRERAIALVENALAETQSGIAYANANGGG